MANEQLRDKLIVGGTDIVDMIPQQVNADWNATGGVSQILNKPNLATVATSGNYNDLTNKPNMPSQGFTYVVFSNKGAISSGTCTRPTIVNIMANSGGITVSLNGVSIWCTNGYHSSYREGVCFLVPANTYWSQSGGNISHVTYCEFY